VKGALWQALQRVWLTRERLHLANYRLEGPPTSVDDEGRDPCSYVVVFADPAALLAAPSHEPRRGRP
jgi:hypothetical protein